MKEGSLIREEARVEVRVGSEGACDVWSLDVFGCQVLGMISPTEAT